MKNLIIAAAFAAAISSPASAETDQAKPSEAAPEKQPEKWYPGQSLNFEDIPQNWVQGEALEGFEKDTVYLIDFWKAPRKGPRSYNYYRKMPGYYGQEILDTLDRLGKRPENVELLTIIVREPSSPERIRKLLAMPVSKSDHSITHDGPSGTIYSTWLAPSGFQGFPHTIVVKNGELLWSGDGSELPMRLVKQAAGSDFDLQKNLAENQNTSELFSTMRDTTTPIWDALDKGAPLEELYAMIDKAEEQMGHDPFLFMQLQECRFGVASEHKDMATALGCMKRAAEKFPESSSIQRRVHKYLNEAEVLKPESYPVIIDCMKRQALLKDTQYASFCWMVIGDAYNELGETSKATEAFEKALSMSNVQRRLDTILAGGTPPIAE